MDEAIAFVISVLIVAFGGSLLVAGLSSSAPVYWFIAGLITIGIGLWSTFAPK